MVTKELVFSKLDEMYRSEKSKKFLNHLIRAYFPVIKCDKIVERPKGKFRCAITGVELLSQNNISNLISDSNYFDEILNYVKNDFTGETKVVQIFNEKNVALTSNDTDTVISLQTYKFFYEWIIAKLIKGDKHLKWLLKDMGNTGIINKVKSATAPKEKTDVKQNNRVEIFNKKQLSANKPQAKIVKSKTEKTNKSTFGDLNSLRELKLKLELIENNK